MRSGYRVEMTNVPVPPMAARMTGIPAPAPGTRITRIAARGEGVAEDGGYHPLAAPDDVIMPDGQIIPGPHHAPPQCPHYPPNGPPNIGACGGCQLQHIDDAAYTDYLRDRIIGALAAQHLPMPELRTPLLSPPRTRRRASLKALRTGKRVQLGFLAAGSHQIIDIRDCAVLHPALLALFAPLRVLLAALMPERKQAEVQMTLVDQGVDLLLTGVSANGLAASEALTAFAETHQLARLSSMMVSALKRAGHPTSRP